MEDAVPAGSAIRSVRVVTNSVTIALNSQGIADDSVDMNGRRRVGRAGDMFPGVLIDVTACPESSSIADGRCSACTVHIDSVTTRQLEGFAYGKPAAAIRQTLFVTGYLPRTKSVVKHVLIAVGTSVVLATGALQSAQAAGPTSYQQFWDDVMKTPRQRVYKPAGAVQEPMTYQQSWDRLAKARRQRVCKPAANVTKSQ